MRAWMMAAALASSLPASAGVSLVDYQAEAGPQATEVSVQARLPPGLRVLAVDDELGRFVSEPQVDTGSGWRAVDLRGDALRVPECAPGGCRIRYRVRLREAARALRDRNRALEHHGALLAPPSSWLARPFPPRAAEAMRYQLRVSTPRGVSFVSGIFPAGPRGRYAGALADLAEAPYSAFGAFDTGTVQVPGGLVEVAIAPGPRRVERAHVLRWTERAAEAVARYYGRLPVSRVLVLVLPGVRRSTGFGTTLGKGGASILMWLGAEATAHDLTRDWVLAHEMSHLGLPNLPRAQRWLEEGLATYLEPVARAGAGQITDEEAWGGLVRGMPSGQPRFGDPGLDHTRSWGRTYWGGALFWLRADLEIRERTGNRRTLADALRGIVDAGGNIAVRWSAERLLETGDRAAGVDVLRALHARMGPSPERVDLDALWSRLGVSAREGAVAFDDRAPLAAVRRALTRGPSIPPP